MDYKTMLSPSTTVGKEQLWNVFIALFSPINVMEDPQLILTTAIKLGCFST